MWGHACITYLSKLHITQKRIARLVWDKQKYYPYHGLFKWLDMLSIYDINKCSLGMFCYKFNFELLPDVIDNFFTKVSNVHTHNTRSPCNFHVRTSRTIYVDTSIKYRGKLLWNQLRDKNSHNFYIFKKAIALFYVVHEYQLYAIIMHICTPECTYVYFYQVFVS